VSYDNSRFTFDPCKDFDGVVMDQGRPLLDSDWNESLDELRRRRQAETFDIVGPAGYPSSTPHAFEVVVPTTPTASTTFTIGVGRMYVDGLLAENHGSAATADVRWDPALAEQAGDPGVAINCLNQPYQPYLTDADLPRGRGPHVVYLDIWQREITYLKYPQIVEPALGIDTTGRWQTVWQVKWLNVSRLKTDVHCATPIPAWEDLIRPAEERLTTGLVSSTPPGPCCLTTTTGYTGKENQHYRVEIQQSGAAIAASATPVPFPVAATTATFKWSRENASVATNISAVAAVNVAGTPASRLTVHSTGKDDVLCFNVNDWVEITDDWRELRGLAGELRRVVGVSTASRTVTVSPQITTTNFADASGQLDPQQHARLIRWDQKGLVLEGDGQTVWANLDDPNSTGEIPVPSPGTSLILEDGITVSFGGASFRSGNYWSFAARSTDGSIDLLNQAPPRGIHHHYARLAVVTFGDEKTTPSVMDCRKPFPPITQDRGIRITQIYHLTRAGARTPLENDSVITLDDIVGGLDIECDQPIDARSVSRPTCYVTIELPLTVSPNPPRTFPPQFTLIDVVPARQTIILDATVDVDPTGQVIRWRPTAVSRALLSIAGPKELAGAQGILTRLILVGNFIWSSRDPSLYLDGDVFGQIATGPRIATTSLDLPSGDGRRGGTFLMWFWLALVKGVSITTNSPFARGVALDGVVEVTSPPRPPQTHVVTLQIEGNPPGLTTTPSVEISLGTTATFQVRSTTAAPTQFTIVASLGGDRQACTVRMAST
jgi:hypothetical protein